MEKDMARDMWAKLINLVNRGYASQLLTNPAVDFTVAVKAGKYDDLPDEEYNKMLHTIDQMAHGVWGRDAHRPAGEVLLSALLTTNIQEKSIETIVELLAEASTQTDYPTTPEPRRDSPTLDDVHKAQGKNPNVCPYNERPYDWTPRSIEREIRDEGIIGQDAAVRAASLLLYNHILGRPSVSLFCGPTGSGKTAVWQALQRVYPKQIVIYDASSLTAEGWMGGNKISTIFRSINPEDRGRIVLVLDEADKILEPQIGSMGTNHSDLVQNQLLALCNHDRLFFGNERGGNGLTVDASNISVVFLGAFQRLLEKKSANTGGLGFGADLRHKLNYSNTEITMEDLVKYGMREELAGRINRITCLDPLTADDLMRIGQGEIVNLGKQLDVDVSIDPDTLNTLAAAALDKDFGARWLKSQLGLMLDDMLYDSPEARSYCLGAA